MHRSGTSAVAGTLVKLGGGPPKHLMVANPGNARGYFESVAFMHFHDELLASAGSRWHDWRLFNPGWYSSPVAAEYRRRAKELFEAEFSGAALVHYIYFHILQNISRNQNGRLRPLYVQCERNRTLQILGMAQYFLRSSFPRKLYDQMVVKVRLRQQKYQRDSIRE